MIANQLINELLPAVRSTDPISVILEWMNEFSVRQLPLVVDGKFIGLVDYDALENSDDAGPTTKRLGDFAENAQAFVTPDSHLFDVLKLAQDQGAETIAVIDENNVFQGSISIRDQALILGKMLGTHVPGGTLVLRLNAIDYSMAEISRLVESNNARIISSFIEIDEGDPNKLKVTLKVNNQDLKYIVATFERFKFEVVEKYGVESTESSESERLNMLFRYLEI